MTTRLERLLGSRPVRRARRRAGQLRDRWVDLPLQQLEATRRKLVRGEADIIVFGDSSCRAVSPRDTDRTVLPDMIARQTGARVATVSGTAFHAPVFSEALRLLASLDERPQAVVVPVIVRACSVHADSPLYSWERSQQVMARMDSVRRRVRYVGRGGIVAGPAEWARWKALPMHTRWHGDTTVGFFFDQLKGQGPPPWTPEVEALRFAYLHGEIVTPEHPGLAEYAGLGVQLDKYGVPVVLYWTQPPLQRGELHFPGEFEAHLRANLALIDEALRSRTSSLPPLTELPFADLDFEDSQNGSEHYSQTGRLMIADLVADAIDRHA